MDIKALRIKLGITQAELAARLGVALYTIQRWESGKTNPSRMAQRLLQEIERVGIQRGN